MKNIFSLALLLLSASLFVSTAHATETPTPPAVESSTESTPELATTNLSPQEKAFLDIERAALVASTKGPAQIPLLDQGILNLPQGYLYVPVAQSRALMSAIGNTSGDTFQGLVLSDKNFLSWFIVIDFIKSGYIKDDDAKNWDAKEMLQSFREGSEEDNKERAKKGIPEIEVVDWIQKPAYDAKTHHMIYSILVRDKGASPTAEQTVNYNTYALGREGYFQLDLVGANSTIEQDKTHALAMVSSLTYDKGKSYAEFVEGTDHVAEYGLGALVVGIAAKKMGLLAAAGVFLAKFGKIAFIAALAASTKFKSKIKGLFGRNKNPDA